jgi:hypothetical protein
MNLVAGDIVLFHCKPVGLPWGDYNLLILEFFETVQYRKDTCAARCLILDCGAKYEVYLDELISVGKKVV